MTAKFFAAPSTTLYVDESIPPSAAAVSTYREEVRALIAAGFLSPARSYIEAQRQARQALAAFRQQWKALPSRR